MQQEKRRYLDLLYYEPYKIGHWLGFKDLTTLHNEWLRSFLYSDFDQTLLGHRGSYKTTVLSLFLALHTVISPNKNILFFRKTDTDVIEVMQQTENILQSPIMTQVVNVLYGVDLVFTKFNNSEINTNLCTSPRGVSQVVGLGIGTSITGKHADVVVTDDIVNLKDRISRAERERTKTQYMELQNIKNRSGRFINTGTPWHKEDAISIMPNVKQYDCYSTGLISRSELEKIRHSMSDSLFAANYELKHIADADAMFKSPRFTADSTLIYNGMCHIDASYGGADATAFTIVKETPSGLILFGRKWNRHVDDCIQEIKLLISKYRAGTVYCEDNADKGYLRKELSNEGLYAKGYHESMNKYVKIATYLKASWERILFLEDTDPDYINEILDYNEFAEHDDCPDSAASAIRQIKRKVTLNTTLKGGI